MAVYARKSYMQEKVRMCKGDTKEFHRALNSVIGKQKSLVSPRFNANHSIEDIYQFYVEVEMNLHKSIADTSQKNNQEIQILSMFMKNIGMHEILERLNP